MVSAECPRTRLSSGEALAALVADQRSLIWQACLDEAAGSDASCQIEVGSESGGGLRRIDALHVTPYGRFGNLLVQIGHAIDIAEYLGVSKIFFDTSEQSPDVFETSRHVQITNKEFTALTLGKPTAETTLKGTFWSLHLLLPPTKTLKRGVVPSRFLYHLLSDSVRDKLPVISESDVVAHFRGGDVFKTDFNTDYVQPPFAFYRKALACAWDRGQETVHIVCEDRLNPAVDATFCWLRKIGRPVEVHSGSLKDDLRIMLSARSIVSSYGTFVPAVMKISQHIKTVYGFNSAWLHGDREQFRRDVELKQYLDSRGKYTKHGEWRASDDQISLILDYDMDAIEESK